MSTRKTLHPAKQRAIIIPGDNGPDETGSVRVVPIEKALWLLDRFSKEQHLSQNDAGLLTLWLKSIPRVESSTNGPCVRLSAITELFANFAEYLASGDPTALIAQRGFKAKPVDVIEFIESKDYVGTLVNVWPGVKDNLWQIWHGPSPGTYYPEGHRKFEIVLTGSIRSGKSVTTQLSIEFTAYMMSLLWNPHAEYGLSAGRAIVMILQSVNQAKAERVLLGPIKDDLDTSPYFLKNFRRNTDINSKIILPGKIEILPLTSEDTSALGENVYCAAITEANAMPVIRHSVKLRYSNKTEYDQARELYNKVRERQVATFNPKRPNYFGNLIVDSSVENPEDFTHQKIEEARHDDTILIINKAIWEVQPAENFPPDEPRFPVEVGDAQRPSKVLEMPSVYPVSKQAHLEAEKLAHDPQSIIWVPEQLKRYFTSDIESALKNFAGRVTAVAGAFLNKAWVTRAQQAYIDLIGDQRLFRFPEVSLTELFGKRSPGEVVDWDRLVNFSYIDHCISDHQAPFSFRVDLSATGDATGIAVSRINGFQFLSDATVWNQRTEKYEQVRDHQAPLFICDGVLRVVSRNGEEIDVDLVGDLCLALNRRINIKWGFTDRAESSRALLQTWRRANIIASFLSVDTDLRPWMELKNALREERILIPPHETLDKELKQLRKKIKGGKTMVDHPDGSQGSKDIADALAGSIYVLYVKSGVSAEQNDPLANRSRGGTNNPRQGSTRREDRRQSTGKTRAPASAHGNNPRVGGRRAGFVMGG